mgnify:CR=1 FL=1
MRRCWPPASLPLAALGRLAYVAGHKAGHAQAQDVTRLEREVSALMSLTNRRHIVGYRTCFLQGEMLCIVTDYAAGGTLDQQIRHARKASKREGAAGGGRPAGDRLSCGGARSGSPRGHQGHTRHAASRTSAMSAGRWSEPRSRASSRRSTYARYARTRRRAAPSSSKSKAGRSHVVRPDTCGGGDP